MGRIRPSLLLALLAGLVASTAMAEPITLRAGKVSYAVDPATLKIDARPDGGTILAVLPPLHAPETATPAPDKGGWRWTDAEGRVVALSTEGQALRVTITDAKGGSLAWDLPVATDGVWSIPDGEGLAYKAADPFWRAANGEGKCLGGTSLLSFPAWSYLGSSYAVTYALGDGLLSKLCLRDDNGVQARLRHDFGDGAETLDLLLALRPPEPLAPALFYREILKARGHFRRFADKAVPGLPRLFAAPHAYVFADGRDLGFLDDLKALGVDRIALSYDQDPHSQKHIVGPAYLKKAKALGYLAGPYEAFDNAQPAATADMPSAIWSDDLYPSGCIVDAAGKVVAGFADRGCSMSSEAIVRRKGPFVPAQRYADHLKDGAGQVFVDVDAFGDFQEDFSPITRCPWRVTGSTDWRAWGWPSTGSSWSWALRTSRPGAATSPIIRTALPRPTPRRSGRSRPIRSGSGASGRLIVPASSSSPSNRQPMRPAPCSAPPIVCRCSRRSSTIPWSPWIAGSSA